MIRRTGTNYIEQYYAILGAMKIPAAFVAFGAVINQSIDTKTILLVIGLMLLSTVGKMTINRFGHMLETEAGYDTCAQKRIQIAEHLRYRDGSRLRHLRTKEDPDCRAP